MIENLKLLITAIFLLFVMFILLLGLIAFINRLFKKKKGSNE